MKWFLFTLPLMAALTIGACDDAGPFDPAGNAATTDAVLLDAVRAGSPALDVMTWNIYVGADLNQLLDVGSMEELPCAVYGVWSDVVATEFSTRAEAIADQIALHRPHVIGLNEVSTFDFAVNNSLDLVFLDVLQAEIQARGLSYAVGAVSTNFYVPGMPIAFTDACPAAPTDQLSYTEYDVLLVRDDVTTTAANNGNFSIPLTIDLPGGITLPKYSGWAYVDVEHKALPYRVFATHLEPADVAPCYVYEPLRPVHESQAGELMDLLDASPYPTILTGDLNSDASGCTTDTYPDLIAAGFADAWIVGGGAGSGFTANQDDDLRNAASELFHRIDFILYRDGPEAVKPAFQSAADVELVGEDPADRINTSFGYDVWPSDHAGVVANLSIAPGMGHVD